MNKLLAGGFECLFLDWNMLVMFGINMLRTILADPILRSLPVLMITAETRRADYGSGARRGVFGYSNFLEFQRKGLVPLSGICLKILSAVGMVSSSCLDSRDL